MTSVLHDKDVAEIDPSAWLLVVTTTDVSGNVWAYPAANITNGLNAARTAGTPFTQPNASMINCPTATNLQSLYTQVKASTSSRKLLTVGTLLRDMGKRIDFMVNGNLAIRWRLVQRVANAAGGGISGDLFYVPVFVCNFAYFGDAVYVVRTGSSPERSANSQYFSVFTDVSGYVAPLVTNTALPTVAASIRLNRGDLLMDLGKTIDFNLGGATLGIRWQLVQRMNNSAGEGQTNDGRDKLYVATYVSDQNQFVEDVGVARTGTSIHNTAEQAFFTRCFFFNSTRDPTLSGSVFEPDSLSLGLQATRAAGISYTNVGSRYNFTSLTDFNNMYNHMKTYRVTTSANTIPFMMKDMNQNVDFLLNGMLAIRWRLMQAMLGVATQWDDSVVYNPKQVLYVPIFVADNIKFREMVFVARVG